MRYALLHQTDILRLKNPYIKVLCTLQVKTGKPEWGAGPDTVYYVLKICKITEMLLNIRRCG